jgi:hypothetical protein
VDTQSNFDNCGGCGNDCGDSADTCRSGACFCGSRAPCLFPPICLVGNCLL